MCDIDVDVCYYRRQEVLKYLKEEFSGNTSKILTLNTLSGKLVMKECGKVAGSKEEAEMSSVTKLIPKVFGQVKDITPDAIPQILTEALAVSFDSHIGHDYMEQSEDRYEFYHNVEDKIPFDLDFFNKITKGGLPPKTLNIALAGTGVGKSLFMCHMAANCLSQGKNVLYITLEMAEERIAERIDANLMNVCMEVYKTFQRKCLPIRCQR